MIKATEEQFELFIKDTFTENQYNDFKTNPSDLGSYQDNRYETLLVQTLKLGRSDIAQYLLEERLDGNISDYINTPDIDGNTAIFYSKDAGITDRLLKEGSNLEHKNENKENALIYHIKHNNTNNNSSINVIRDHIAQLAPEDHEKMLIIYVKELCNENGKIARGKIKTQITNLLESHPNSKNYVDDKSNNAFFYINHNLDKTASKDTPYLKDLFDIASLIAPEQIHQKNSNDPSSSSIIPTAKENHSKGISEEEKRKAHESQLRQIVRDANLTDYFVSAMRYKRDYHEPFFSDIDGILLDCIYGGDELIIGTVLENNPGAVNIPDENGNTAIFYAASIDVIKLLLDAGGSLNHINRKGNDAITEMLMRENFTLVSDTIAYLYNSYLKQYESLNKNSSSQKNTLLAQEKFNMALTEGKEFNEIESPIDFFAVIIVTFGSEQDKKKLQDQIDIINLANTTKKLALCTKQNDIKEICECLKSCPQSVHEVDEKGNTAIFYAKTEESLEALITNGADISHTNNDDKTAADLAIEQENFTLAKLIILQTIALKGDISFFENFPNKTKILKSFWQQFEGSYLDAASIHIINILGSKEDRIKTSTLAAISLIKDFPDILVTRNDEFLPSLDEVISICDKSPDIINTPDAEDKTILSHAQELLAENSKNPTLKDAYEKIISALEEIQKKNSLPPTQQNQPKEGDTGTTRPIVSDEDMATKLNNEVKVLEVNTDDARYQIRLQLVNTIIDQCPNAVNYPDGNGQSAICYATSTETVKLLLDAGASLSQANLDGKTVLTTMLESKNFSLAQNSLEYLKNNNRDAFDSLTESDSIQDTIKLAWQTYRTNHGINIQPAGLIIDLIGSPQDKKDLKGLRFTKITNKLIYHVKLDQVDQINFTASKWPKSVGGVDKSGNTALFYSKSLDSFNLLIAHKSSITHTNHTNQTALTVMIDNGHLKLAGEIITSLINDNPATLAPVREELVLALKTYKDSDKMSEACDIIQLIGSEQDKSEISNQWNKAQSNKAVAPIPRSFSKENATLDQQYVSAVQADSALLNPSISDASAAPRSSSSQSDASTPPSSDNPTSFQILITTPQQAEAITP